MRIPINLILKYFNIFIIYRFGNAIGDQVCMSAIVKEIYLQKKFKVIVFSSYPEIFFNNPYVWKNLNIKKYNFLIKKILEKFLHVSKGGQIENFCFPSSNSITFESYMRDTKAKISLINAHSLHFKLKFKLNETKPDIFFTDDEIRQYENKFKELENFAIIQPTGKTTYTPNKEWDFEKYQNVINNTQESIKWVQVGFRNDKLLDNVIDLRDKTNTLRELAFVIKKSNFVLSNEGLLNHIAASVDTKSFIVFSGFSQIELAKYDTTIPIVKSPQIQCAPCWILEKCPKEIKYCTEDILVDYVVKLLRKERNELSI